MLRFTVLFYLTAFVFSACKKQNTIADSNDYNHFINDKFSVAQKKTNSAEINFWSHKLQQDTGSYVYKAELAAQYLSLFRLNGQIKNLIIGDSLLRKASEKLKHTNPELLYSLSQNSVAQHQFIQAADFAGAAAKANGDAFTIRLLQFDACMELGNYAEAYRSLQSLADRTGFDYLIRKAKWEDHKGNLDEAIMLMEQAFKKIKHKKQSLYVWTKSNLADMYGHAGRIEDAYRAYLDVLKKDPANLYCLKGIAWIAWSYDKNAQEAERILKFILSQTEMPELRLVLSEIYSTQGKNKEAEKWKESFLSLVTQPAYGTMYNKYLIDVYTQDKSLAGKALAIAEAEIKNRFTPETNDWLAWTYFNLGQTEKAYEIVVKNVYGKTFEPTVLFHTACIYAASGKKEEARNIFQDCLESAFEIGPLATIQIKEMMNAL